MIGKIVLGICMVGLVIAFFYGIYMAIWGVWNERQQIKTDNIFKYIDIKFYILVLYNNVSNKNNINHNNSSSHSRINFKI